MGRRPLVCFTFVGDVTRDSRLRRMAETAAETADVVIVHLCPPRPVSDGNDTLSDGNDTLKDGNDTLKDEEDRTPDGTATQPEEGVAEDGLPERKRGETGEYDVITIPMHGSLRRALPRFWRQCNLVSRRLAADTCVAADLYSLPGAARGCRGRNARLIYDARELYSAIAALQGRGLMQRFWTTVERRVAARADIVLTVNASIAAILRHRFRDVRVVRNVPDFSAPAPSQRLRETIGCSSDRRILLSQGGLQRGRGALPLVELMPDLPDCELVFLGDGPLRDDILAAAAINGVSDRVHLIPAVPSSDLPHWTASADLGLCMIENLGRSYYLSLPNKLFEYLACGVPVVGSDFPEIGAVLRETGAGIAVDPTDRQLVLRAIRTLLDDPTRYARARESAQTASFHYHWSQEKLIWKHTLTA
ncbi:MAG: glycosyltransferase [Bacteroidota bacterium]|jgi:glycosyltransferase involved in cell wall biosynthesis|nr:glycosyltransferase [Bacteroidota bacterium]